MPSDAYTASEQKLAAAHKALLQEHGLQLDFKAAPKPQFPDWLLHLLTFLGQFGIVFRVIFWGGLAVGAALIVWFIVVEVRAMGRRRRGQVTTPAAAAWRPDADKAHALLEEADGLAAAGRFDEAIHLLLFRSIDDLAGRRPGVVRPALTSRDIGRLDGMPAPARDAFGRIASRVETSFFGGRPVSRDDFAGARGDYEAFAFAEGWR